MVFINSTRVLEEFWCYRMLESGILGCLNVYRGWILYSCKFLSFARAFVVSFGGQFARMVVGVLAFGVLIMGCCCR